VPDFITAGAIRQGLTLPADALNHADISQRLLEQAARLPAGSVIALQGSWGRGKTDAIARMAKRAESDADWAWLWINPWQYGDANLLTPLVLELLSMIPAEERSTRPALIKAARTILLAGLSFGLKASKHLVPGPGALIAEAAGPASDLLSGLFDAADIERAESRPDPDPIAKMSVQFAVLSAAVLASTGAQRLIICVDDLDRCLPDRQVALLQALRFLLSSAAEVRFAVAIDPTLARQALRVHYSEEHFDPDLYLDKMFDLRVNLPAVNDGHVGNLIRSHLRRPVPGGTLGQVLTQALGQPAECLADEAAAALCTPGLRNPRLIRRMIDRLYLLLAGQKGTALRLGSSLDARWLLVWLVIAERWPAVRTALQVDPAAFTGNLAQLHRHMLGEGVSLTSPALALLGASTPEQRQVFAALGDPRLDSSVAALLRRVDEALVGAGL